jgi:hypothetical protein
MSDTPPPDPGPATPPSIEQPWVKPVIAIGSLVLFAGMTGVVVVMKNDSALLLMAGAAVSMATTAFNYYLGSSSGSARKTEISAVAVAGK